MCLFKSYSNEILYEYMLVLRVTKPTVATIRPARPLVKLKSICDGCRCLAPTPLCTASVVLYLFDQEIKYMLSVIKRASI